MLLTPISFIWVFQILIGYSKFLRNADLRILIFFQLGIFVDVKTFLDFTVCFSHVHYRMEATYSLDFRELSLLKIGDTILNPGLRHL